MCSGKFDSYFYLKFFDGYKTLICVLKNALSKSLACQCSSVIKRFFKNNSQTNLQADGYKHRK